MGRGNRHQFLGKGYTPSGVTLDPHAVTVRHLQTTNGDKRHVYKGPGEKALVEESRHSTGFYLLKREAGRDGVLFRADESGQQLVAALENVLVHVPTTSVYREPLSGDFTYSWDGGRLQLFSPNQMTTTAFVWTPSTWLRVLADLREWTHGRTPPTKLPADYVLPGRQPIQAATDSQPLEQQLFAPRKTQ